MYFVLNSQLWGELQLAVFRKGLQLVTLSLYGFPIRLLFPVIAFALPVLLYDIVCQISSWMSRGYWRAFVLPPIAYVPPCYAAAILRTT